MNAIAATPHNAPHTYIYAPIVPHVLHPPVVDAQNKVTSDVLARCSTREQFKQLFTALYNYPKYGTPFKRGNRYGDTCVGVRIDLCTCWWVCSRVDVCVGEYAVKGVCSTCSQPTNTHQTPTDTITFTTVDCKHSMCCTLHLMQVEIRGVCFLTPTH